MSDKREHVFVAPVFLATAFLLFGMALVEKFLNLLGGDIPFINVYPNQLLSWAVTLLIFDIALLLRQILENRL